MKQEKLFLKAFSLLTLIVFCMSCEKPAGPGGRSSVQGRVYVRDFDKYATTKLSEYWGSGETVYICYGSNTTVGNDIKTSTDGSFQFLYLNKGHYKVFVNSRDTSIHYNGSNKTIPETFEFDITGNRQVINLGTITINK